MVNRMKNTASGELKAQSMNREEMNTTRLFDSNAKEEIAESDGKGA